MSKHTSVIHQGPHPHEGTVRCSCGYVCGVWALSEREFPAVAEKVLAEHNRQHETDICYGYCGCTVWVLAAGVQMGRCSRCGHGVVYLMGEDKRLSVEQLGRVVDALSPH